MTKLTGIIMSENKLTGSLGARNQINVDIIGTGPRGEIGPKGEQGIQGIQGPKGEDGSTPIKGTDYWTNVEVEEMKAQLTQYINTAILGGES